MTSINNLGNEIARELERYTRAVEEELDVSGKQVAAELVKDLKQTSPKGKTGDYKKGWRVKKKGNKFIIHNATDYQLTHLLEHGHAKRNGGRVDAKVHIRPAEDKAISDFLDKVERAIEQ